MSAYRVYCTNQEPCAKPLAQIPINRFAEGGDDAFPLKQKAGRQVQLPGKRDYWPDKTYSACHREHKLSNGPRKPFTYLLRTKAG